MKEQRGKNWKKGNKITVTRSAYTVTKQFLMLKLFLSFGYPVLQLALNVFIVHPLLSSFIAFSLGELIFQSFNFILHRSYTLFYRTIKWHPILNPTQVFCFSNLIRYSQQSWYEQWTSTQYFRHSNFNWSVAERAVKIT